MTIVWVLFMTRHCLVDDIVHVYVCYFFWFTFSLVLSTVELIYLVICPKTC